MSISGFRRNQKLQKKIISLCQTCRQNIIHKVQNRYKQIKRPGINAAVFRKRTIFHVLCLLYIVCSDSLYLKIWNCYNISAFLFFFFISIFSVSFLFPFLFYSCFFNISENCFTILDTSPVTALIPSSPSSQFSLVIPSASTGTTKNSVSGYSN